MFSFGKDHWAQAREIFERQFEPNGDQYVYRRSQKGPPIQVSPAERDHFIDDYGRRLRYTTWGIFGGLIVFTALIVWWTVQTGSDLPETGMYVGIGAVAAVGVGFTLWVWGAPTRELARRTPVGRARTNAEVRKVWLRNMSYTQLASTAVVGILAGLSLAAKHGGFVGWGKLWIVFAASLAAGAGFQAFRKWRFEREDRVEPF